MELTAFQDYATDAIRVYQECCRALIVQVDEFDLQLLSLAARRDQVSRRGNFSGAASNSIDFHIHGSGYSFRDNKSGKVIGFDVDVVEGRQCIRVSPWNLHQYLMSAGQDISEEAIRCELLRLSEGNSRLKRIIAGPHEFYVYFVE